MHQPRQSQDAEGTGSLNVISATPGIVCYPSGGTYGPRIQIYYQLVLVDSGVAEVWIDGVLHTIPRGHLALLKPGHTERFVFAQTQETWHRWIAIELVEERKQGDPDRWANVPFHLPISSGMNQLMELLLALKRTNPATDPLLCSLGKSALLLVENESRHALTQYSTNVWLSAAKVYVIEHYGEPLSLQQLAAAASVSPEHLIRLFRKHEGTTPMQYVWAFRVNCGLDLLRNTGLSVKEIAERCGFKTSYHFAHLVKQYTRKTPTDIRRESLGTT